MSVNFLDLKPFPVKEAEAVILPIPYEATVSYGGGTKDGPEAMLKFPAGRALGRAV